jgi:transposase
VADGNGFPLAILLTDGRRHDIKLAIPAVEAVEIGCRKRRPRGLAADKGYDCREFRQYLRARGIRHSIPERKGKRRKRGRPPMYHRDLSSNRWKVERLFGWLDNFRRLATRFERYAYIHLGLIQLASAVIVLDRLLK